MMRLDTKRFPTREFTILYREYIKDTLMINRNLFRINPNRELIDPMYILAVTLDSLNFKERLLRFVHFDYHYLAVRLDGEYHFFYDNDNWVLAGHRISISDGWYKLPKY